MVFQETDLRREGHVLLGVLKHLLWKSPPIEHLHSATTLQSSETATALSICKEGMKTLCHNKALKPFFNGAEDKHQELNQLIRR